MHCSPESQLPCRASTVLRTTPENVEAMPRLANCFQSPPAKWVPSGSHSASWTLPLYWHERCPHAFWQAHARSQGRWSLAVPTEAYTTKQTCPRDIPPASQSGRACTCRLTLCPQRVSASAPIPAGLHQVCHAPLPPVVRDKLLY